LAAEHHRDAEDRGGRSGEQEYEPVAGDAGRDHNAAEQLPESGGGGERAGQGGAGREAFRELGHERLVAEDAEVRGDRDGDQDGDRRHGLDQSLWA
jgi:hypothetical protein